MKTIPQFWNPISVAFKTEKNGFIFYPIFGNASDLFNEKEVHKFFNKKGALMKTEKYNS